MKRDLLVVLALPVLFAATVPKALADEARLLRLVPFPKQVKLISGQFKLDRSLVLQVPQAAKTAAERLLIREFTRIGIKPPKLRVSENPEFVIRLSEDGPVAKGQPTLRRKAADEDYALHVTPQAAVIVANESRGLLHGLATLGQLIRANQREGSIRCLEICDWPSIRWRAFQDDLTRGPSTRLSALKRDVDRGALLKLNIFTYYMQSQFAFAKHPDLGPADGSLTPEELTELVAYAHPLGVDIMGNQQSFAHMQHALAHPQYAHLKEDDRTLSPVKEGTYELLDDLYSELLPILPFEMFNVCCDETWGLGTKGPSKQLADQIGPGGVYVQHIRRVYDLVHGKYGKRMMMWGDIILKHPDKLDQIPQDVIMLTWGYDARDSFEDQIVPFAESSYEFFVCPGVNNWSRILPDFLKAVTNIHHFVRDGTKHGVIGVLNTSWDDDGENLNGPNWYGFAWGAECAWNGSQTTQEDFDRRIGAVMFGEPGAQFGRAIQLLSDRRFCGMPNRAFWEAPTGLVRPTLRAPAQECLDVVRSAIEHLEQCRSAAKVNTELIDSLLFGARRIEQHYRGQINRLSAAQAYDQALKSTGEDAARHVASAAAPMRQNGETYRRLRAQWKTLWNGENKPYALDWSLDRYDRVIARLDEVCARLTAAEKAARDGLPLPPAAQFDLQIWAKPDQLALPGRMESSLGHYKDYYREFAVDGDLETFYWSDRGLVAGDDFTLLLNEPARLETVTVFLGTDRYRQEYVHNGVLEVRLVDGSWTKVADLNAAQVEASLPAAKITALRLRANEPQRFWLIVREIVIRQPNGP